MTATPPGPADRDWPQQPAGQSPIQDPAPVEPRHPMPYGSPPAEQLAMYQTFAGVRQGISGIALSIKRPGTGAGRAGLRIQINDRLIPAEDGQVFVTVPPGRHAVIFDRTGTRDRKVITVDVPPGQAVPLYYSMPLWVGASGAVSHAPVDTPGVGSFVALIVGMLGIVGLLVGLLVMGVVLVT